MKIITINNSSQIYSIKLKNLLNKLRIQEKNKIILPENYNFDYSYNLKTILFKLRLLNDNNKSINLNLWNSNIKYRTWFDNSLTNFKSKFYLEQGKWVDFILLADKLELTDIIIPNTIDELIKKKRIRIALLLFWRDIVNKLSLDTVFKLQLKLTLGFKTVVNSGQNIESDSLIQVRSIGHINIYSKNNFNEVLSYLTYHLSLIADEYSLFFVKDIILTFNICHGDSILNKIDTTQRKFNLTLKNNSKNKILKNKLIFVYNCF